MIGRMRERVTFQSFDKTIGSVGQSTKTPVNEHTTWAACQFLAGRELEAARKINTEISLEVTTRYRTDLNTKMQMVWRGLNWNLHAILPDERKQFQRVMASRVI
jgi:SPP1 family predicted phage head-tail adaptor